MPQRLNYTITITNQHTGAHAQYHARTLVECADAINMHYGLHSMITQSGVVNMLVRGPQNTPQRFSAIHIDRNPL